MSVAVCYIHNITTQNATFMKNVTFINVVDGGKNSKDTVRLLVPNV